MENNLCLTLWCRVESLKRGKERLLVKTQVDMKWNSQDVKDARTVEHLSRAAAGVGRGSLTQGEKLCLRQI